MRNTALELEFEHEFKQLINRMAKEVYNPKKLKVMCERDGYLNTARNLAKNASSTSGFLTLCREGRHDLTLKYLVIQPKYSSLFVEKTVKTCKQKLGIR